MDARRVRTSDSRLVRHSADVTVLDKRARHRQASFAPPAMGADEHIRDGVDRTEPSVLLNDKLIATSESFQEGCSARRLHQQELPAQRYRSHDRVFSASGGP